MHREIREVELADLWRPAPGGVAPWVQAVICGAASAMIGLAAAAARAVWNAGGYASGLDGFWFRNGLAIGMAVAVAAAFLPPARVSRFVRLAAMLPIVLVGGTLATWGLWGLVDPELPFLWHSAPFVLGIPIGGALAAMVVVTALAVTALAALAVRRRRAIAWTRAAVVVALVQLLLMGLWLPIASGFWGQIAHWDWYGAPLFVLDERVVLLTVALGPPILVGAAVSAIMSHRPALVRRARPLGPAALAIGGVGAVVARLGASPKAQIVYLNLVPFLAASAVVAAGALAVFVAGLWRRARRARARLGRERAPVSGVIVDDGEDPRGVVACLELEGWLRGPRALVTSFEVATEAGPVPIPVGAELVASLPAISTVLHVGESIAVLRRGDRVVVGGMVAPPADHPFRGSSALVSGPDGVVVRREDDPGEGFASIALVAWRPCVALLMILIAVALPGLAAVVSVR